MTRIATHPHASPRTLSRVLPSLARQIAYRGVNRLSCQCEACCWMKWVKAEAAGEGEDLEGEIRAKFGQWTQPDPKFWIRRRLSCWRERRAYWCRCERKTCCWPDWPDRDAVLPVAGPSRRRSSRIPATSWPDRGNAAPDPPSSDDAGNFHGRDPRG